MISLGGLSAAPAGFQTGQNNFYALQQQQQQQQAMQAYGQALAALAGGGQGPIPTTPQLPTMPRPMATPQVAPQPAQPPNPLLAALQARGYSNVAPTGGPAQASPAPPQPSGPAQPAPQAAPAPGNPGPQAAPAPAQPAAPQVRVPSTAGIQPGSLTWPSVVNAIKQANPKISPAALAGAVNQFVPLMNSDQAQQWKAIDEKRADYEAQTQRISANKVPGAAGGADDVNGIVDSIISGDFPPPGATGSARFYTPTINSKIGAELAKRGFNLSAHIADWNALQRATVSQNSPVVTRSIGAINAARSFLDTFQKSIDTWNASSFPTIVNQGILDQASKGQLPTNDPAGAQKQAALIKSQYADLITLLSSVFQGGGVPTNTANQLAKEQVDLGWSRGTINSVIDQINNNLNAREASIRGVQPSTPGSSAPNSYSAQPAPAATSQTPAPSGGGTPAPAPAAAGPAPEGTIVQMQDGTYQVKKNGQWVPYS